jgi:hypothetical protein
MLKTHKKLLCIILFILIFSTQSSAFDEWTTKDTKLQVTFAFLHIMDWGQTRHIARNPGRYFEKNWILGEHPSVSDVDEYFISALVVHTTISYMLPKRYRGYWQVFWIGAEYNTIKRNYSMGIKIKF